MAATYKGLLTNNGKALIASATLNNKINYSHIAVGDGNGSVPNPLETRTALVNEKARIALNVVEINPNNTNQIICEAIIPSNLGGFYIRELGLYAGTTMVVNASYPPTYKPLVDEGGAREIAIKLVINIQNAEVIALYLDDSLIYATRTWVDTNYIRRNELVDNLTTDDAKKPVSAKQAKALQDNKLDKTANAVSSSKLETARTISFSGAATGSFNFDGSGNSSCILALANSGVVANTYGASLKIPTITVNAKGLITGVSEQNIPIVDNLTTDDATKPLSAAQGKVLQDSKLGKTGEVAVSATKLQTARTIGGVSFDGSANINLPGVNTAGNQNTTGNAATATTAAACSGNAATATKLQTARTINGVSFDGSANITIADNTKLPLSGGTITGSLNVSDTITVTGVGDHANAFKKLIQADTTTDGGYIAVGNNGSDKGYVEIGTIDDPDAAIYARKRNGANTILDEAVILGPDNNTSFPNSVFIHNAIGGYGKCGLVAGAADDARYDGCNIDITSWFGLGIKSSQNGDRTVVFNTRNGDISTKGSLHATGMVNGKGLGINNTEGTGHGLSLYGGTDGGMPNYGISFAQTYHYGTRGYVNGDWATYFTMTGGNNRGWIFRHADLGNVASISSQGFLSIPTMKMDRSNFQIEHHSTFSIYYDFATRIVRIVMKVMSAVGVGHSTSPFKVVEGRWTATFALPITLQVRLSAEFAFQQVGLPGYKPWDAEAGEWHAWCAPPGHRGSTESAVTVDVVRWRGGEGEAVDGYLTVVGFF